jgi:hypothetical protein
MVSVPSNQPEACTAAGPAVGNRPACMPVCVCACAYTHAHPSGLHRPLASTNTRRPACIRRPSNVYCAGTPVLASSGLPPFFVVLPASCWEHNPRHTLHPWTAPRAARLCRSARWRERRGHVGVQGAATSPTPTHLHTLRATSQNACPIRTLHPRAMRRARVRAHALLRPPAEPPTTCTDATPALPCPTHVVSTARRIAAACLARLVVSTSVFCRPRSACCRPRAASRQQPGPLAAHSTGFHKAAL